MYSGQTVWVSGVRAIECVTRIKREDGFNEVNNGRLLVKPVISSFSKGESRHFHSVCGYTAEHTIPSNYSL